MNNFRIITTRGNGPGGQHKNKVESCVEVIHIPTGLSERCQKSRSQLKNKKTAMDRLLIRLDEIKKTQCNEELNNLRLSITRDRIKTYNFKTGLVIDHRTGKKASLIKVLNGDLELLQ